MTLQILLLQRLTECFLGDKCLTQEVTSIMSNPPIILQGMHDYPHFTDEKSAVPRT